MDYLPVFFALNGRTCAVVGDGPGAMQKTQLLLRSGARVRLLCDKQPSELAQLAGVEQVTGALCAGSFDGCTLVIVALADASAARTAAALAASRGLPVNVVDRPELCTFIMPAIVDRDPVLVAISTGGAAPVLGRLLRARLEAWLPRRLGELASLASEFRTAAKQQLPAALRRRFWEHVLQGPVAHHVLRGDAARGRADLHAVLAEWARSGPSAPRSGSGVPIGSGEVYLITLPVGNESERMSLLALRLLQQSDIVYHPDDLPIALLDLVRRDAERRPLSTSRGADDLLSSLIAHARSGQRVSWLATASTLGRRSDADGEVQPAIEIAERLSGSAIEWQFVA